MGRKLADSEFLSNEAKRRVLLTKQYFSGIPPEIEREGESTAGFNGRECHTTPFDATESF